MSMDRRFVLKGMALGSLAGLTLGGALPALGAAHGSPRSSAARPALVLVNQGAEQSAFVQGARATGAAVQVRQIGGDLTELLSLQSQLGSGRNMRLIGLLDDASAALVVDMARSAGARVEWLGQHTARGGVTRHRLLNTASAEGCARQLGRQLHGCGAGFELTEERLGSAAPARQLSAAPRNQRHADQWAAGIGYLLGSLGAGRPTAAPLIAQAGAPLDGSFVSFSIET